MLRLCTAAIAASLSIMPATGYAQARLPQELDTYIVKAMAEADVPGMAIAVVHGDDTSIAQGFGVRRMGRAGRVDADTIFNIASLTKSFTAAGAATLVDEGNMGWDDPVQRWLPTVRFSDPWLTEHVTLTDLLSHRTGLEPANTMWRFTAIDRAEIVRRVRYLKPAAGFRTQQVYNNTLYTLAGETIAAAAGTSWETLIRARLLQPLGMAKTTVSTALDENANVAVAHAVIGGIQQPIRPSSYITIAPAGGINSTAADMTRWLKFQMGDGTFEGRKIVSKESMQAMHEPWTMIPTTPTMRAARQVKFFAGYGLGWNVMDYRGHKLIWHSGNADGMISYMAILPDERVGVVVMLNSWKAPFLHNDITLRILDHYLGLPTKDYAADTLALTRAAEARAAAAVHAPVAAGSPPLDFAAYEGVYIDDLYGRIAVVRTGASLFLKMGEGQAADLTPLSRDTFTVRWRDRVIGEDNDTSVTFTSNDKGKVTRLAMQVRRDSVAAVRTED